MHKRYIYSFILPLAICAAFAVAVIMPKTAVAAEGDFSLQVSPSPLVNVLKPGETTTVDLTIRNAGSQTEKLKINPRSFKVDNVNGELKFEDNSVPEVVEWLKFGADTFTIEPGQIYTQKVTFAVPSDAGFSYSFALVIKRQENKPQVPNSGRQLEPSLAIFTLLNIDRPGATRSLEVASFSSSQLFYEYLPAELTIKFRNTGNTIVQPGGNVFIQRGSEDKTPINTLDINSNDGYILPGSVRKIVVKWDNGFPVFKTTTASDGTVTKQSEWNWKNLSSLRIGYYKAKMVAVYNDGQRDVPIVGEVGFWVVPWKIILILLVVILLLAAGVWSLFKKSSFSKKKPKNTKKKKKSRRK